jgi:hypothetical protein
VVEDAQNLVLELVDPTSSFQIVSYTISGGANTLGSTVQFGGEAFAVYTYFHLPP